MLLEAKNNSDKTAKLYWNEIFVLDTLNKIKYSPDFIMNNSAFNIGGRSQRPLKAQQVVSKRLIYFIPNGVKTEFLGINSMIQQIPHTLISKN
ncbi:MAG: hypothetical protein ACK5NK_11945 [Niabella sp.]